MLALVDLYLCIHRILLHYLIKIFVIIYMQMELSFRGSQNNECLKVYLVKNACWLWLICICVYIAYFFTI